MMIWFEAALIAVLGLLLGSFSSALIYRVPRGLDWVAQRSACTLCNKSLSVIDLIPLITWLVRRGRCGCGKQGVSALYPGLELAHMTLVLGAYACLGFGLDLAFALAALPFLVALVVIDWRTMLLPNILVLIVAVLGVGRAVALAIQTPAQAGPILMNFIAAGFVFAGLLWALGWGMSRLLKRDSLGFGDVKFFCAAGFWLGFAPLPYFLMASGVFGVGFALLWKFLHKTSVFPFGPAIILALWVMILVQGLGWL
jgi:leader peptidase (prepilin peptidase)/N-methyltransferase